MSEPKPPPPAPRARRGRRWVGLAVALAIVVVAGVGALVALSRQNADRWQRLDGQVDRFGPPSTWTEVGRARQGSADCFISCDAPRVTLVYRTDAVPATGCDQARQAVEQQIGPPTAAPDLNGCGWSVALDDVDDGAFVMAGSGEVGTLRRDLGADWRTVVPPTGTGTLVWLEFNSGID